MLAKFYLIFAVKKWRKKIERAHPFLALYGYTWGFAGFLPVQATLTLRIRKGANLEFSGQYTVRKDLLQGGSFLNT